MHVMHGTTTHDRTFPDNPDAAISEKLFQSVLNRALQQLHGIVGGAVPLEVLGGLGVCPVIMAQPQQSAGDGGRPSSSSDPLLPPVNPGNVIGGVLAPTGVRPGSSATMVVKMGKRYGQAPLMSSLSRSLSLPLPALLPLWTDPPACQATLPS